MNYALPLAALLTASAAAQIPKDDHIHLNEIFASLSGVDTGEYIELAGTAGLDVTPYVVCTVSSMSSTQAILTAVWDITGQVPAAPGTNVDGYYVLGGPAANNVQFPFPLSANNLADAAQTIYLMYVPTSADRAFLANQVGSDITTVIGQSTALADMQAVWPAAGMIVDKVALVGSPSHQPYDCAPALGLGGAGLPAGVARPMDYPMPWYTGGVLDPFPLTGDGTPGAPNVTAMPAIQQAGAPLLHATGGCRAGTTFCSANSNSTGAPCLLQATVSHGLDVDLTGIHLDARGGPATDFGYYLIGTQTSSTPIVVSNGNLCLSGAIGRYNLTGTRLQAVVQFDSAGVAAAPAALPLMSYSGIGYDIPLDNPTGGLPNLVPGTTYHFQLWYRDTAISGSSNFSDGASVTF